MLWLEATTPPQDSERDADQTTPARMPPNSAWIAQSDAPTEAITGRPQRTIETGSTMSLVVRALHPASGSAASKACQNCSSENPGAKCLYPVQRDAISPRHLVCVRDHIDKTTAHSQHTCQIFRRYITASLKTPARRVSIQPRVLGESFIAPSICEPGNGSFLRRWRR